MQANQVLVGDCLTRMAEIPAGWAHCVVTSPPYFALRSYLPKDHPDKAKEIGSEPTPDAFIATMLEVFRGVRRVLRDDGQLWLNLGDSYEAGTSKQRRPRGPIEHGYWANGEISQRVSVGMTPGCQLLMPHRVALALVADGWCLRSTVIWQKLSPMPESVSGWRWRRCRIKIKPQVKGKQGGATHMGRSRDMSNGQYLGSAEYIPCPGCKKCIPNGGYVLRRGKWRPTNAFEYLFQFSKGKDYFGDGDAVAEPSVSDQPSGNGFKRPHRESYDGRGQDERWNAATRNPRNVWTFPNEPFKGKHFATFPSSLPKRCIEASTSAKGCCPDCGACYAPIVESVRKPTRPGLNTKIRSDGYEHRPDIDPDTNWQNSTLHYGKSVTDRVHHDSDVCGNRDPERHVTANVVTGYRPTCLCLSLAIAGPVPCRVFDPFLGSGQTARAAHWLGRDWLGCELNPTYADLVPGRIAKRPKWATASDTMSDRPLLRGAG